MNLQEILNAHPAIQPTSRLLWTAIVTVGQKLDLGPFNGGHRYLVPIIGGEFHASPDAKGLTGIILPGGADRQFVSSEGVKELDAIYEMQISDGPVISIRNQVKIENKTDGDQYALSQITAKVADGPYDWLNRRVIVGTLQSLRPHHPKVVIRAWEIDA